MRQFREGVESKTPLANSGAAADLEANLVLLEKITRAGEVAGGSNMVELFAQRMERVLTVDTLASALRNLRGVDERLASAMDLHRRLAGAPGRMQIRKYIDMLFDTERPLQRIAEDRIPLADNATWQKQINITPPINGTDMNLDFRLFDSGDMTMPYRDCYLYINSTIPWRPSVKPAAKQAI
jgi:hypothetical protein